MAVVLEVDLEPVRRSVASQGETPKAVAKLLGGILRIRRQTGEDLREEDLYLILTTHFGKVEDDQWKQLVYWWSR